MIDPLSSLRCDVPGCERAAKWRPVLKTSMNDGKGLLAHLTCEIGRNLCEDCSARAEQNDSYRWVLLPGHFSTLNDAASARGLKINWFMSYIDRVSIVEACLPPRPMISPPSSTMKH